MSRYEVRKSSFGPFGAYELTDTLPGSGDRRPYDRQQHDAWRVTSKNPIRPPCGRPSRAPTAYSSSTVPPNRIAQARFGVDGRAIISKDAASTTYGLVHSVEWKVASGSHQFGRSDPGTTLRSLDHEMIGSLPSGLHTDDAVCP